MDLKTILEQENHSVETELLGQKFTINAQRNIYNVVRNKYRAIAIEAKNKFAEINKQFDDIHDLINSAPDAFIVAIEKGLNEVIQDVISVDIYTLDKDAIVEEASNGTYFVPFFEKYGEINSVYERILQTVANNAEYREMRKNNRPRWQSASFGGGQINARFAQLDADIMNAEDYIAHAAINFIANKLDERNARNNLKALFENEVLRQNMIDSVYDACFNLHLLLLDLVETNSSIRFEGRVSEEDKQKAQAMFNNFVSISLTPEKKAIFINDIFQLNPYNRQFYKILAEMFGDEDNAFGDFSDFFGMNIHEIKNSILTDFVEKNLGETEDDAHKCQENMLELAKKIGLNAIEITIAQDIINEQLKKLDLEYRTVDEIVLDTREEADLAREELKEIKRIMDTIQPPTAESTLSYENDLLNKKQQIEALKTKIKEKYIDEINKNLEKFDKKFRKQSFVNEGMTREEAGQQRALQYAKTLNVSTYENLDKAKSDLEKYLPEVGITPEQSILTKEYFDDCENKLNTVDGVVLSSREEADLARKELEEIMKIMATIQPPTAESTLSYENDLLNKKQQIETLNTKVKEKYIEKINSLLESFDKKFRKQSFVNEGMTREEAGQQRALQYAKTLNVSTYENLDKAKSDLEKYLPEVGITPEQSILTKEYFNNCERKLNTVDGVEFSNRDEANFGRNEYSEIVSLMAEIEPPTKDSLLSYEKNLFEVKARLEKFSTDIKLKYISLINEYLNKFDSLFKQTGSFSKAETRQEAAQYKALKLVKSIAHISCTYEDIDKAHEELMNFLPEFGIDISQAFAATDYLKEREDKLNTVDNVVLSTREEAALAKEEFEKIQDIMCKVLAPTNDSLLDYERNLLIIKEQIESFTTTVKNKYLGIINKYLADFDAKFKKVSLIKTASTREEAGKERALKFVKSKTYNVLDDINSVKSELERMLPNLGITIEQAKEATDYLKSVEDKINGISGGSKIGGFMNKFKK